ncbi:MAG TPA: NADPH:quinone oxidoreductase family protein [Candidatus Dormibacteraeota bacterium]|nr:NADPH:quinone oxidoreductase family protein [Candidatus Dormibacteraeota bacterium]
MRAQQLQRLDGPAGLRLVDIAEPDHEGRVLIEVHAAGVAFPDLLLSRGLYQRKPPLPFVPGVEVAGTVRAAPDGAGFAVGDRVVAFTGLGGYAELAVADVEYTAHVPDALPANAAGGFVMNHHTVHVALTRRARLRAGELVAVHGAAGGIGTAAVQMAKALGARVIALVSSAEKARVAEQAGADVIVDTSSDWVSRLRAEQGGTGVDVIVDPVGGDRFEQSVRCLAPEGRLLVLGFTEGRIPSVQANRLLLRNASVVGVGWGAFLSVEPSLFAETQRALNDMIEAGAVQPIVGAEFPLEQAADALRLIDERRAVGKVVLTLR